MSGLGHDQDLTVEEVRYRIRSFAPDEFRPPLSFARCWTSVRKAKEGEVKGDIFGFLTCERTPRSATPQGRILRGYSRIRQAGGRIDDRFGRDLKGSMFISSWTTTSSTRHSR